MYPNKFKWIGVSAFFIVLLCMPLGHAAMILMEHWFHGSTLNLMAFLLGLIGLFITIGGSRMKSDSLATFSGFFGGLFVWTGWVEFLYIYYAKKLHVSPLIENGEVVTKPEYLLLMSSVGFWAIIMIFYIFRTRSACSFYCWIQSQLGIEKKLSTTQLTNNKSMITFMETNMLLWTCYLLLMFAYDESFLGERHPVTLCIAVGCLIWSVWLFVRLLKINAMGRAIRYALPTVIIFWTFVEVMGRIGLLKEIWVEPIAHKTEISIMVLMLVILIAGFMIHKKRKGQIKSRS